MGATYTRQSSFTDGDVITADLFNNEYDQLLAAFAASTGHTHDGTAAEGGPITKLLGTSITIGDATSGTDITVTFDGESNDGVLKWMEDEDYFEFSDDILIASTEKIQFRDTGIYLNSSADGQLDIVADTEVQIAATTIDINGAVDISGNLSIGGNLDVTGTFDLSDSNFTNAGDIQLDSISGDGDTNTSITFSGSDVITFTNGGETQLTFNNGSILPTTDNDIDLGSSSLEFKDLYIDGTAYLDAINYNGTAISATAAELNIMDGVTATTAELNLMDGVTATTAELNIMDGVTATAAELNILDASGSTIGDLSEISTIANDDVFLALDTSGGGIKKVSRSAVVAGLATSSAISNVADDSTPQLGGNLDLNGNDIVTTSNATLDLAPNGTGTVVVRGNTNSGAIVFNCESNSHGQTVIAQPHSAGVTNTMLLPAGADSTLVSLVSTDTLTNKTLTSPKINEDVAVTSTATEINILDGVTATTAELNILDGVTSTAAELNILDGVTSTATELNLLDGSSANSVVNSKAVIYGSSGELAGTLSTAAQTNVTSLGTLTALTVDDVAIDGKAMTMTGSSSDTAVFTVGTNGALSIVTTDDAAAAANIQITADGTAELAGTTVTLDSGGDIDLAATNDVNLPANVGLTFGNDGEKIEGDGTNLAINSSGDLNVTATTIDIDGNVEISGTAVTTGVHTFTAVPVFPNDTVETADIQADAITGAKIADNAINSEHYTDGSIDQAHLADAIVNEAKMQISNSPTDGYFLSAQSGNTGGLTWAQAGSSTTAGDVGTYVFVRRRDSAMSANIANSGLEYGNTYAGSDLRPAGLSVSTSLNTDANYAGDTGSNLSGTYRAMGYAYNNTSGQYAMTLMVRTA